MATLPAKVVNVLHRSLCASSWMADGGMLINDRHDQRWNRVFVKDPVGGMKISFAYDNRNENTLTRLLSHEHSHGPKRLGGLSRGPRPVGAKDPCDPWTDRRHERIVLCEP